MARVWNLLFILLLLSSACSPFKPSLTLFEGVCRFGHCEQFLLKSDRTFEYYLYNDIGGLSKMEGCWEIWAGDTIIINTYQQAKSASIHYSVDTSLSQGCKAIRIFDWENESIGLAVVYINQESQQASTDDEGLSYFTTAYIADIQVNYLGLMDTFEIQEVDFNSIEIFLKELETYPPTYVTNQKIILRKHKIILLDEDDSHWYELKKTKLSHQKWY